MSRGKRVMKFTCYGQVITRLMKEANLTYQELYELTGVSKSTLHGWANGVIFENPDVLIPLKETFSRLLKREITTDDILFGKDEDREEMRKTLEKQKEKIRELEMQLALFELEDKTA